MRELTVHEVDLVNGAVSDDAQYGAGIGVATAALALMFVPGIGPAVAISLWGLSLSGSIVAINAA